MTGDEIALLTLGLTAAVAIAKTGEKLVTALVRKKWPGADRATAPSVQIVEAKLSPKAEEALLTLAQKNEHVYNIISKEDGFGRPLVHGWHVVQKIDDQDSTLTELTSTGARLFNGVNTIDRKLTEHDERIGRALNDITYAMKKA